MYQTLLVSGARNRHCRLSDIGCRGFSAGYFRRRTEGYRDRTEIPNCYQSSAGVIQAEFPENWKP